MRAAKNIRDAERLHDAPDPTFVNPPNGVAIGGEHLARNINRRGGDGLRIGRAENRGRRKRDTHEPPLQFIEFGFNTTAIGDVSGDFGRTHDGATRVSNGRDRQRNWDERPVFPSADCVEGFDPVATTNVAKDHVFLGKTIRRYQNFDGLTNYLFSGITEQLFGPAIP